MEADALATVFMVMPPEAALRLANDLHVPALLIGRGDIHRRLPSSAWPTL
jgi:thiamine biosynthesis lipoprotein ApbE